MRTATTIHAIALALALPSTAVAQMTPAAPTRAVQDRISVKVIGAERGPDLILIPGLASSREVWAGLAARLKGRHRLHLVQLAGFAGMPAAPDPDGKVAAPTAEAIAAYIQRQGLKRPVVIGHSLGGEVGLMLASRHPDMVGRLMIVDALPFYSLLLDPAATGRSIEPRAAAFRTALLAAPAAQAEAMQAASLARLVKTEAERPAVLAASRQSDRKTVADASYELMTTDLRKELPAITAPVEVVYAYDPAYGVPASAVEGMFRTAYAATPHVRFTRIDDSFHFVMLDQPGAFERAVTSFLEAR